MCAAFEISHVHSYVTYTCMYFNVTSNDEI